MATILRPLQAAIDNVSALPLEGNGFRGAVQLDSGIFKVSSTLKVSASGVILRGKGTGTDGTFFNMTGDLFLFLNIAGTGSWQALGNASAITDTYVPSGAASFHVDDGSGFQPGDTVLVRRPVTAVWIHFIGMDTLVRNGAPQTWTSPGTIINTDHVIQAIEGNEMATRSRAMYRSRIPSMRPG